MSQRGSNFCGCLITFIQFTIKFVPQWSKWNARAPETIVLSPAKLFLALKWTRWPQSLRKCKHEKIERFEEYRELDVLKLVGFSHVNKVSICGLWWHFCLLQQDIYSVFIFVNPYYAISRILFNDAVTFSVYMTSVPIPVASWSKALVCGRSLAGVAGSNTARFMNACFLWVFCVVR
jgi:hypothetical protein